MVRPHASELSIASKISVGAEDSLHYSGVDCGCSRTVGWIGSWSLNALSSYRDVRLQICLTYAILNPFILVIGIPYFAASYIVYKHQMLYVYDPMFETGGVFFPKIFRRFVFAITIAQVFILLG